MDIAAAILKNGQRWSEKDKHNANSLLSFAQLKA
jgi:hypothetical protein